MKIEMWDIGRVKPYEHNPRKNDGAVEAVAKSIREFGFRVALVVDADGVLIAGHTRLKAAEHLGLAKVPVHVAKDLTPDQVRALRIADNKLHELSSWDMELLPIEIADLQSHDFDLSLMGFSADDLSIILAPMGNDGLTDPDDVPEPPDDPVTKRGDLIILGQHRLLCGDSGRHADLDRLLDGEEIDLVNTDPPYNVKVEPRSNNAIAAGLPSITAQKKKYHKKFDLARHPEIDSAYCDVIVERWEKFTGRKVERVAGAVARAGEVA